MSGSTLNKEKVQYESLKWNEMFHYEVIVYENKGGGGSEEVGGVVSLRFEAVVYIWRWGERSGAVKIQILKVTASHQQSYMVNCLL